MGTEGSERKLRDEEKMRARLHGTVKMGQDEPKCLEGESLMMYTRSLFHAKNA